MKKAIYKITNNINNKIYIGQTTDPNRRWRTHKSNASHNVKTELYDAMRQYGIDAFTLTVIGWYADYDQMEQYYIELYNTITPNGYNMLPGGEPPHRYGEEHPNSLYSDSTVELVISNLLSHKYSQADIARKYNVTQALVNSINKGATHRKSGIEYPIVKTSKYHCSEKEIEEIIYLLANSTCTCAEIGVYFGFDTSTIKAINSGQHYFNESLTYPIRNFRGKKGTQSVETILAKRSTEVIDTPLEM